jgi:hypothetical protein
MTNLQVVTESVLSFDPEYYNRNRASSSEYDERFSPIVPRNLEKETNIAVLQYIQSCIAGGISAEDKISLNEFSKRELANGGGEIRSILILCQKSSPDAQKIGKCVAKKLAEMEVRPSSSPLRPEREGDTPLPPGYFSSPKEVVKKKNETPQKIHG